MPRTREYIGSFNGGTVVEYDVHDVTDWVQVGSDLKIIRCDNNAKENGWGLWIVKNSNGTTSSWVGGTGLLDEEIDHTVWIKHSWSRRYNIEKDVG